MKKRILSITCLVVMMSSYGQDYHPFLQNIGWCLEEYFGTGSVMNAYANKGDTTIAGVSYSKLLKGSTLFLAREDVALRKVWVILPNNSSETLLYDFAVSTGTQISLNYAGNIPVLYHVDSFDSINTPLGYRKRIKLSTADTVFNPALYWIEGIGSNYGPVYLYDPTYAPGTMSEGHCLICAYAGIGAQSYSSACGIPCIGYQGSPCYSFMVGMNAMKNDHTGITIENTSAGLIRIRINNGEIKVLKVFSVEGKLFKKIDNPGKNEFTISTHEWRKGLYIIEATDENGRQMMEKIIK